MRAGEAGARLRDAASRYNDLLRWKKFPGAAAFLPAEERSDFLKRYLAVEDDLNIVNVEIVAVNWLSHEPVQRVEVTVTAESHMLPSTVIKKTVMVQRWEWRDSAWLMVGSSDELVPPLDATPSAAPQQPTDTPSE